MTEFSGWGELRPQEKVAHYYVAGTSLCNKVGFFRGDLTKDEPEVKCETCDKRRTLLASMPSKKEGTTTPKAPAQAKTTTPRKKK